MIGLSLFIFGMACGAWLVILFRDTRHELTTKKHKGVTDEMLEEIVRLRTQVALHVGKDKV